MKSIAPSQIWIAECGRSGIGFCITSPHTNSLASATGILLGALGSDPAARADQPIFSFYRTPAGAGSWCSYPAHSFSPASTGNGSRLLLGGSGQVAYAVKTQGGL